MFSKVLRLVCYQIFCQRMPAVAGISIRDKTDRIFHIQPCTSVYTESVNFLVFFAWVLQIW